MKRIKRSLAVLVAIASLIVLALPAAAAGTGFDDTYYRVSDSGKVLTSDEVQTLEEKALKIRDKYNVDIAIGVFSKYPEGYSDMETFSDDLYEAALYGYGSSHDGVMLVINMNPRKWYITTEGYGIKAFTDYGIEYIGNQIKSDLSDGNYYEAFDKFLNLADEFIASAKNGKPIDTNNKPESAKQLNAGAIAKMVIISLVIGLIVGFIVLAVLSSQLKSVKMQDSAKYYTKDGSLKLRDQRDVFLFHTVSKSARQSSSSGGGSSTHFSSSGRSHGGGGGSF